MKYLNIYVMFLLISSSHRYVVQIWKCVIEVLLVNKIVNCSLESSHYISDAKRYTAKVIQSWAYGKEKIRRAERNLPTFSDCARVVKKIFRRNFPKLLSTGGGRNDIDYEKFLLDSIFPTKLTEFPTKLTEFVQFIFIISQYSPTVKRILPDWLCLPKKLAGGGGGGGGAAAPSPPPPPPPRSVRPWIQSSTSFKPSKLSIGLLYRHLMVSTL